MDKRQLEFDETDAMRPPVKRCGRCNRKLKTAEALQLGYGKKCWHIIQANAAFSKEDKNGKNRNKIKP